MAQQDLLNDIIKFLMQQCIEKDEIIKKLQISNFFPYPAPSITFPSFQPKIETCIHEYPNPWFSVTPPSCKKCGQQAPFYTFAGGMKLLCNHHYPSATNTTDPLFCTKCGA